MTFQLDTSGAPELPKAISSDGREIWDWAARFSDHVHRLDEMRRLREQIFQIGRGCGDCSKWMKRSDCPREHNVNGQTRGPSMSAPVCREFTECPRETARRDALKLTLAAMEAGQ